MNGFCRVNEVIEGQKAQAVLSSLLGGSRKRVNEQNPSSLFTRSEERVVQRSVDRVSPRRHAFALCIVRYLSPPGLPPTLLRSSALSSLRVKRASCSSCFRLNSYRLYRHNRIFKLIIGDKGFCFYAGFVVVNGIHRIF